jgi:hypothetical protein
MRKEKEREKYFHFEKKSPPVVEQYDIQSKLKEENENGKKN